MGTLLFNAGDLYRRALISAEEAVTFDRTMLLPSKLGAETVLTPGGQRDSSQPKRFAVVHTRPWPRGPDPPSTRGRVGRVPPILSGGYTSETIRIAGDGVVRCATP